MYVTGRSRHVRPLSVRRFSHVCLSVTCVDVFRKGIRAKKATFCSINCFLITLNFKLATEKRINEAEDNKTSLFLIYISILPWNPQKLSIVNLHYTIQLTIFGAVILEWQSLLCIILPNHALTFMFQLSSKRS